MKSNERILITGGAGFIGSHLAGSLLEDGASVAIIDNLATGRWENLAGLIDHPRFHFAIADIRDAVVLDRMVSNADTVIHLAAAVGVQLIVEDPVHTIETNIMGTEAVLKAALRYRCKTLITTTSEVYGKGIRTPFSEEDDVVLGATDKSRWSYAATKMVDEFLALAYHHQYGLPVILVRLFNTVGPRQTGQYGMVVPRFVKQALNNDEITVYGDGEQSRCFCDVQDVIVALKALLDREEAIGTVFNVGSQEEITIRGLAERIQLLLGSDSKIVTVPYSDAYAPGFEDMVRRVPNTARIEKLIGWRAETKLTDIILRVAHSLDETRFHPR
ncbi:MAG: GDP-mannose 4,6-dehydratase [Chthoniobacterales bacterium]|nr:GDP-mannose 4,6-dehydratase [Chthoniobacterales bacterium]